MSEAVFILLYIAGAQLSIVSSMSEPDDTPLLGLLFGLFLTPLGAICGLLQLIQNLRESKGKCLFHTFKVQPDKFVLSKVNRISPGWSDTYVCKKCKATRWFKGSIF